MSHEERLREINDSLRKKNLHLIGIPEEAERERERERERTTKYNLNKS